MNISIIIAIIALPFSILSGLSGYLGFKTAQKQHSIKEYRETGALHTEINTIKQSVNDLCESQKRIHELLLLISERTARLEQAEKYIEKQLKLQ